MYPNDKSPLKSLINKETHPIKENNIIYDSQEHNLPKYGVYHKPLIPNTPSRLTQTYWTDNLIYPSLIVIMLAISLIASIHQKRKPPKLYATVQLELQFV